ncbi:NLR family CARD domain-containing protein 3 isoform X1 [Oreochromis niloticus]|uniref:NLR family CARD domain-containing protein 3 n=1 Tax=Oreochromis niloticus TaxID=8128 RepID=A0A669C0L9_ORENI|nr:NLR family CARD domain-containing protein 3 isoform X1 [Oreochromis niloticus]
MALCENKEELPPPSKATLCGDEITKAQSPEKEHTPHTAHREPEPSCMSVMSNQSNERYIDFKQGAQETKIRQRKKSPKPEPVCVSTMSSSSNERYIDFKQAPVETRGHQIPDTSKPGPSCVSMMSDQSNERHIDFKQGAQGTKIRQRKKSPKPEPVCVSTMSSSSNERHIDFSRATENSQNLPANEGWFSFMKNWIMDVIMNFLQRLFGKQLQQIPASTEPDSSAPTTFDESVLYNSINELDSFNETLQQIPASTEPEPQLQPSFAPTLCNESVLHKSSDELDFKLLEDNIITFVKNELKKIQKILCPDNSESQMEEETLLGGEGEEQKKREALVKLTLHFLRTIKKDEWADRLQNKLFAPQCQRKLKSNLKKKFQCVFEGIAKAGHPTLLNQIYTELYITEGGTAEVNNEHEVRQLETASRKPDRPETTIRQEDIFKRSPGRDKPIRTVLTKGVAGIGKTVLIQKLTLDWAEEKANPDIHFTFPFTFRELNVLKKKKFSLVELVHHFFAETKKAGICRFEDFQVVFILDGLDECRLPLDFHNTEILTDVTLSTSVDVLLTNLIRGKLLPSARVWITTRPAAASQIPPKFVDMVTEVRGFTDPQKEEYFRKRFRDEEQANRIITHIKKSRSLHIMCHIPVFCWITATVLEDMLKPREGAELPKTLTEMYIHFLVVQSKVKKVKYDGGVETDSHWNLESRKMIESLGKLAFDQLENGKLIFYESDLTDCGIDIRAASVYSGVFTQIFKEEKGLYQNPVFCFIHLSVQEFLAALHVHLTFINSGVSVLPEEQTASQTSETPKNKIVKSDFYQHAVDKALQSPNGHLDLFLRFLLGLSLQTNQDLLKGLQTQTESSSETNKETVQYIKKKIGENLSAEKSINLFHCLNELNDRSLVEEIQQSLSSGSLSIDKLSPAQWSALVFILLSSENDLDVFDLKKYSATEEALLRLLPVVKASRKAVLTDCNLSKTSCEALTSVLSNPVSSLLELDLSNNTLQDSGVKALFVKLGNPDCKLETLRLSGCQITEDGCRSLVSALNSKHTHLKELDLSYNNPGDSGVQLLSDELQRSLQKLEILRLSVCNLSEKSCEALSPALSCQSSSLRELDLNNNNLKDTGAKALSTGLESQHCKLETLRLSGCLITKDGCASLASALNSNPSHLKVLDLSYNHPEDAGVELQTGVKDQHWKLEILRVEPAGAKWLKPGLKKYLSKLTVDTNTINKNLKLSTNNMKVTHTRNDFIYPDHADRFVDWCQLLCKDVLHGRCYWEVEWTGEVDISVSYRGIGRKGERKNCRFGENPQSWSLDCSNTRGYTVYHNQRISVIHPSSSSSPPCGSKRVAVYVDCPAGTVSFYNVSSDSLIHLHTFNTKFIEPLYPGFGVWHHSCGSSVRLCSVQVEESPSVRETV